MESTVLYSIWNMFPNIKGSEKRSICFIIEPLVISLAVELFAPGMMDKPQVIQGYLLLRLDRNCLVRSSLGLFISSFAEPFSKIIPSSMKIAISATSLAKAIS